MGKGCTKLLNKLRKQRLEKEKIMASENKKSKIPQCLTFINDLVSRVDKGNSGLFKDAPDYFKQGFDNIRETLMGMFKNLTMRMTETPAISSAKITAIANSGNVDEEIKRDLIALAKAQDGTVLTPELIDENLDTFRVTYDSSNIEANDKHIVFNSNAEFSIMVDGVEKTCKLEGKFKIPTAYLTLTDKE